MFLRNRQRGFSMIELLAAAVVAAALVVIATQMLLSSATQQQAAQRRLLANNELANVAERIAGMHAGNVTEEKLAAMELSAGVQQSLPDAQLTFDLQEELGPPAAKRITISITWPEQGGEERTVRLTTWKFADGGER